MFEAFGMFFFRIIPATKEQLKCKNLFQHFQSDYSKKSPKKTWYASEFCFHLPTICPATFFFVARLVQVAGRLVVGFNIVHKLHETLFSHKVVGHSKLRIEEHVMQIVVHPEERDFLGIAGKKPNATQRNKTRE